MLLPHKTKIVATLGPASADPALIAAMIRAGMNAARLNFSHGDFAAHARLIAAARAAADSAGRDVAIMADLPGPKMRIGDLAGEPIGLEPGAAFILTAKPLLGDARRASVTFPRLPLVVAAGDRLFVADGVIELEVTAVRGPEVHCRVIAGGELRSRQGINLPGIDLGGGAFTDRDHECLRFALDHGADAVSQSFVESAADLEAVRRAAAAHGRVPFIIAKIERARALDRLDEILAAADGIMIARGDLGVETPIERIAILQKDLIRRAVRLGKPVITATHMLESMTHHPQPTRAEATDVANAILDGTDAVMLSGESATGKYPLQSVATLARIAAATEPYRSRDHLRELQRDAPPLADLVSVSVEAVIELTAVALVVAPTLTGATARSLARFRLPAWVVAPCRSEETRRQLLFSYGVEPMPMRGDENWNDFARAWQRKEALSGRLALLIEGPSAEHPGVNHRLELIDLG